MDVLLAILRVINRLVVLAAEEIEALQGRRGQRNDAFMRLLAHADEIAARARFGRNGVN